MTTTPIDLLCLSHLRWDFVLQRPQHLMSRFARNRRVFFFEEASFEGTEPQIRQQTCTKTGVHVIKPVLPVGTDRVHANAMLRQLLNETLESNNISEFKKPNTQAVVYPPETASASVVYPYAKARR